MAYNEELAQRARQVLKRRRGITENRTDVSTAEHPRLVQSV